MGEGFFQLVKEKEIQNRGIGCRRAERKMVEEGTERKQQVSARDIGLFGVFVFQILEKKKKKEEIIRSLKKKH